MNQCNMKVILVAFFVVLFNSMFCLWEEFAGPYYIRVKHITACRDMGRNSFGIPWKLSRYNRTHKVYRNNVSLPIDINNNALGNVMIQSKGINGHSWNALLNTTGPACDIVNNYFKEFIANVFEESGYTFKCPMKKGNYSINFPMPDYLCNYFSAIPVFPYGDMRAEVSILSTRGGKSVRETCLALFFESRPMYEIRGGCTRHYEPQEKPNMKH